MRYQLIGFLHSPHVPGGLPCRHRQNGQGRHKSRVEQQTLPGPAGRRFEVIAQVSRRLALRRLLPGAAVQLRDHAHKHAHAREKSQADGVGQTLHGERPDRGQ
jgi:hypothetical protein